MSAPTGAVPKPKSGANHGFWYAPYAGAIFVTGYGRDSKLHVGDIIASANGVSMWPDIEEEFKKPGALDLIVMSVTGKKSLRLNIGGNQRGHEGAVRSNLNQALFWRIFWEHRSANNPSLDPEIEQLRTITRQRRTLANHLHTTLRALRSTRQELADALDRLAVTAEALGEEKTERILEYVARITLSENLKKEQETNTRLDAVVRRLSARPRIKRGTTHVEIGGIVFRNRTSKRRSLA